MQNHQQTHQGLLPTKYSPLPLCCIQLLSCLHGHFCFPVNVFRLNWSGAKYLSSPLHPSHFSLSFFVLDQFLDLIHHMDPQAVESAQLRLARCNEMAEVNTRRSTGGGRDRLEHDSKISIAAVCFASWKHGLGLSQSIWTINSPLAFDSLKLYFCHLLSGNNTSYHMDVKTY